ncbi:hypothetical protein H9Q69_012603 [Fusarium xylarioides]|nr:hypothetical protein H9Q69_012603 [Fusarium xylarioides]
MCRRSGRLASRQSGDAKEHDEKRSEEEQGESSSMHAKVPQEWDDDDDEYDDDRDTAEYTQSRRKMSAQAIATPASSKKIRDSLTVTYEDSEFKLSEIEEDKEFLVEGKLEQECFDLSELPLDPSEVPPEEPEHMLKRIQKIFSKKNLRPIDLLNLPKVPYSFSYCLIYMDIPVRAGVNNITRLPGVKGKPVKSIKHDVQLESEADTQVYMGSAISKLGAYTRIRAHEEGSDGKVNENSVHYNYTKQPDVAPNLRIVGVWSNPFVVDSLDSPNDIDRWLPVFLEGILMVYLGLVHRSNVPLVDRTLQGVFSEAKYVLIDHLRSNLELPDFHNQSLNLAWSIAQGVNGGMVIVNECSNPDCKRPKFFKGKKQKYLAVNGSLSERICGACYHYARKHDGELRNSNKTRHAKSQGARVCNNPNCRKVEGSDDKGHFKRDILDNTKWRCNLCYGWQRNHNGEDRPAEGHVPVGDNRSCCNPNCDIVQVPGGPKLQWRKTVTATGTVEWRCDNCHGYFKTNGVERPSGPVKKGRKPQLPGRSCSNCGYVHDPNGKR